MEKRTLNNLALLKVFELDPVPILELEWERQVSHQQNYSYKARNYVDLDFFTYYFQNLITSLSSKLGDYKNIVVQCHDKRLCDEKWHLNIIHKDAERQTCITIPLLYNVNEPINFYGADEQVRGHAPNRKPLQRINYSRKYPNLVNVSNNHNVRIVDDLTPRILLQLSYDIGFDEFIHKYPDYWEII